VYGSQKSQGTLGTTFYTDAQLLTILQTPVGGDASLILADQLIAALLNIQINKTDSTPIAATLTDANTLLGAGPIPEGIHSSSTVGQQMVADAAVLNNFNNGNVTTACAAVPVGSCQPSSSLSVLVSGTNVTSYVPKGNWSFTPTTGVSVINVEGTSITPTLIPTPNVVNSCASNPVTGKTVCTANNTDVYLLSGTTLSTTLTDSGVGTAMFSGGSCTTCGVAMDATHNKAVVALNVGPGNQVGGYQYLDLGTSTFETAFASKAPAPGGFATNISEDILIDPIRNLILSPDEGSNYELVNVATTTSPTFFENTISSAPTPYLDSAGEDCSTGIALSSDEDSSGLYIADLTQATFTAGSPGTWTAASQFQTLAGAFLSAGTSGLAVAQGTHTGITSGEFGGDAITALALPTTSGTGTPAISDWVTCSIGSGFSDGFDPHTVTAYQSPNSGDAIALLVNAGATSVAVVDLTKMLNSTIVPRTGNVCTAGTLPATVVSFITVP
jgi:hypothetical protein